MYILDEPTTGLHSHDIKTLRILQAFANTGNTVVVIEHNLDVIKTADHIIDMGPEIGINGGEIIAEGTPEKVSQVEKAILKFIKELIGNSSMKKLHKYTNYAIIVYDINITISKTVHFSCYNNLLLLGLHFGGDGFAFDRYF